MTMTMTKNNPSWKIDELARRVLHAARWPMGVASSSLSSSSPTPHLDELEWALEIFLPPLAGLSSDDIINIDGAHMGGSNDSNTGSVRTCTLPTNHDPRFNSSSMEVLNRSQPRSSVVNSEGEPQQHDEILTTLDKMAPFSPEFYRCVGEMTREAFNPGSVRSLELDTNVHSSPAASLADGTTASAATTTTTTSYNRHGNPQTRHRLTDDNASSFKALASLEVYSLPRMMDAVRITRILLALQEIGEEEDDEGNNSSFIESLLHYCEGMNTGVDNQPNDHPTKFYSDLSDSTIVLSTNNKVKRIPILSSLFHHWSSLPQLEHAIQQLSRKYSALLPMNSTQYGDYYEYCKSIVGISHDSNTCSVGSVGDGGSTGGEWKPTTTTTTTTATTSMTSSSSSSTMVNATSFLGNRALRIDSLKMRLETELDCHINGNNIAEKIKLHSRARAGDGGLKKLFALFYQYSNSTLRGKCRRWMGQWLRSFALGGSSGSSSAFAASSTDGSLGLGPLFASFCPLVTPSSLSLSSIYTPTTTALGSTGPISLTHAGGGIGGGVTVPHNNPLGMENTSACGVEALLYVLIRIIQGFHPVDAKITADKSGNRRRSSILRPSHENLLFDVIIPLHKPSGLVLWRDQTPLIGLYHEALVKVLGAFLTIDRMLVGPVIGALLHPDIWPCSEGGNTPKVVLLLHEVDNLIGLLLKHKDSSDYKREDISYLASLDPYLTSLVSRLCVCIASDNSRTSERALQFFRNETFQKLVQRRLHEVGHQFIRALCRCPSREVPWNPTVRKMTLLVLKELEGYYKKLSSNSDANDSFREACETAFTGVDLSHAGEPSEQVVKSSKGTATVETHPNAPTMSGNMTSLRASMGSWKPPPRQGMSSNQPPLTVTGVAPWAMRGSAQGGGGLKQPPLAVTGVAPWAMKKEHSGTPFRPPSGMLPQQTKLSDARSVVEISEVTKTSESRQLNDANIQFQRTALDEVRAFMEKLKPQGENEEGTDGVSSWAKAQMAESPLLYPNLKFHDLVFGQELGTGAFSTVKYARLIVKNRTRSTWPEYAVKIVSTQKIEELGYEQSINREIAILRTLSHPGISRLVSSFRFRDGAYLVLEYASGGDLHTLLRKNGSLDNDSTRFVIGSVAAALWSIHERGFVFADCKPENILITETGHIKVTDFGGCRPVTQEARILVKESSKNLVKQLRDGDWKTSSEPLSGDVSDKEQLHDDIRIEGTTAYLPPEVVIGGFPTTAADIWALGCVMFQCISGRPPILENTDQLTVQKIVTFDLNSEGGDFFGECDASTFRDDAKSLITRMLNRDALCRPDILHIATAEFFKGMDIFTLHKKPAHPLDVGTIAPITDAKWSRRQFSSIWAPQPRAYNLSDSSYHSTTAGLSRNEPISEGDEADEDFFSGVKAPVLTKIRE